MQRTIFYSMLSVLALAATLTITSCSDDDPSTSQTNLDKLAARHWKLTRATVGGVDKTALYSDLVLQWSTNKTFSAENGGAIWPSAGTFSFTDDVQKTLLVSLKSPGDTQITVQTLTETQLIISFHWNDTTIGHGRVESIEGDYIFEFTAAK